MGATQQAFASSVKGSIFVYPSKLLHIFQQDSRFSGTCPPCFQLGKDVIFTKCIAFSPCRATSIVLGCIDYLIQVQVITEMNRRLMLVLWVVLGKTGQIIPIFPCSIVSYYNSITENSLYLMYDGKVSTKVLPSHCLLPKP